MSELEDINALINKAGELIGTEPSLKNVACIEVALDYCQRLIVENDRLNKMKIKVDCPECGGTGYTSEHDPISCNCDTIGNTCPVQIGCINCQGACSITKFPESGDRGTII